MSFKKSLILLAILLCSVLFITRGLEPYEAAKARSALLLKGLQPQQLRRIGFEREGSSFTLVNSAPASRPSVEADSPIPEMTKADIASWSVEGIPASDLDLAAVNSLTSSLVQLKFEESDRIPPAERSPELAEYGLATPVLTLKVTGVPEEGGELSRSILFGSKHEYLTGKRFAKLAEEADVYLINDSSFTPADKKLAELRNKAPVEFSDADLASLELQKGREKLSFVRDDTGEWKITEPLTVRANEEAILGLTRELRALRASDFIDQSEDKLVSFGLASPQYTAKLTFKKEAAREPLTLILSTRPAQELTEAFFHLSTRPTVFKVTGRNPIESLFKPVQEFRLKRFAEFDIAKVRSAEFISGSGAKVVLARDKGSWTVNGKEGDLVFVREALKRISDLEAVGYPKESTHPSFDAPRLKVTVILDGATTDAAPREILLVAGAAGAPNADGKNTVLAAVGDRSEPFLIAEEVFTRLMPTEEQLVKPATPTPSADVVATATP